MCWRAFGVFCAVFAGSIGGVNVAADPLNILVYSRTTAFRHPSIPAGIQTIQDIGAAYGFNVVATENPADFTDEKLAVYDAVVFLQTSGNPLEGENRTAFERYIQSGGGFVGVHAAADVDGTWPWYVALLGARFMNHPEIQTATMEVVNPDHPSTQHLGATWQREDEWYNFHSVNPNIQPLLNLDESSYQGGSMGEMHPIAWHHHYDGGRSWYTNNGHRIETYSEPDFISHLAGGIMWAAVQEGDYNRDGLVDAADYVVWRDTLGATGLGLPADGDGDRQVGASDYARWAANFGKSLPTGTAFTATVPESLSCCALLTIGTLLLAVRRHNNVCH